MKKNIFKALLYTLICGVVLFYFILPPLNFSSIEFYNFIFILLIIFVGLYLLPSKDKIRRDNIFKSFKLLKYLGLTCLSYFLLIIIINVVLSPMFSSRSYANRISIDENGDFKTGIEPANFNSMPLLDRDSSEKLGDRVMGQIPELVSQFSVSDMYTQINYNDEIIRVTPLEYNGLIKYFANRKQGVAGYITVNSVNGEAKLKKLDKGIKYVSSAYFFENLERKLRFSYPTAIFGDVTFEIDNEGNPYWVAPIIKYSGVGLKPDIKGVVLLNAIDGTSTKYDVKDVPTWVDHVYSANLIMSQVDDWGLYKKGFLNSLFGQKNVVKTTDGYNYLSMKDDIYLYTGITSISADEANIGFILTNMRTKQTVFYSVPGAEEYSAMNSAKGQVQQMSYTPTFPLLINLNNKPTYLISLKDNAGLVKMYAFVDVEDYQKVTVSDASKGITEAATSYLKSFGIGGENTDREITIKSITSSIINGNTYYYIIDVDNKKYRASISVDEYNLPFIKVGDKIKISALSNDSVMEISKIGE